MAMTWRTVRVFVSSTFRDMHAERDYLARVVFPELRERCVKRQLHLVDLDLRWGVTEEEAEQGKVLEIILDEIDRSRPFFIAILGERYGSVLDEIPEDAESAYPWLRDYHDHSLTALEIMHGVLRNPDLARRSFFYFRDPKIISQIPESRRIDFVAESPEAARKLARLKNKILVSGCPVMENYPCRWDNAVGRLVDLDAFGRQVLEDLWTAICAEYPEEAPEADPLAIERQMHEAFAEERSRLHVGRLEEAARLTQYVQGIDRRPVVITGESGCGKSAFLANWYRQYASQHPDDFVLAYFIGASPDSTNHHGLLRNMCGELKRRFALAEEIPQDEKKLSDALAAMLTAASWGERAEASFPDRLRRKPPKPMNGRRIVIVLDALNQLLPLEAAHGLGWLLDYMPEKVRLVVSSLEGDCLEVLRRREAEEIVLPPLTMNEQRQIVQVLLGEWGRKLDDRQMAALLAHREVKNPLYLRVALQELRLFGIFEQLKARIEALAEDIPGLFDQVLERLEEDHGREPVEEAFSLLGCSRYGLSEAELLNLLTKGEEQFPRALWARLTRSPNARAYLVQRGELIDFFHRQLADAVARRYLSQENKHAKLAAYFEHAPLDRKLDEYPHQLQRSKQWEALATALSDLDLFEQAWDHAREYEWTSYWRSLEGRFEPYSCYQTAVATRLKEEGDSKECARLLHLISRMLKDMALYRDALHFERRALLMKERVLGPDHPDIATSLINMAWVKSLIGSFEWGFFPPMVLALEIRECAFGPEHPNVAACLHDLAGFHTWCRRDYEALPLYERALAIRERALGPNHPDVLLTFRSLECLRAFEERNYSKALSALERGQAILERTLGTRHPEQAWSFYLMAKMYKALGEHGKALPLLEKSLAIQEKSTGTEGPFCNWYSRSLTKKALTDAYLKQGKHRKYLSMHVTKSLRSCKEIIQAYAAGLFGPLWQLFTSFGVLAIVLSIVLNQGWWAFICSIVMILGVLLMFVRWSARLHLMSIVVSMLLVGISKLAGVLSIPFGEIQGWVMFGILELFLHIYLNFKLSRYTLSRSSYWEAEEALMLAVMERHFGRSSVFHKLKELAHAPTMAPPALTILERNLGHNHPDQAKYIDVQAEFYYLQGKYDKAISLYQRELNFAEAIKCDYSTICTRAKAGIANSIHQLGVVQQHRGNYDEAEKLYKQSLKIKEKLGDQAGISWSIHQLGTLEHEKGNYDEAEKLYKQSLKIEQKLRNQAGITRCFYNLGCLSEKSRELNKAAEYYEKILDVYKETGERRYKLYAEYNLERIHSRGLMLIIRIVKILLFGYTNPVRKGALIFIGALILSIQRFTFVNPFWGCIPTAFGLLILFVKWRGSFTGILLSLVGILNVFGGEFGGWSILGVIQLLLGLYMIRKLWKPIQHI